MEDIFSEMAGKFETEEEYTLNPDGTGKVRITASYQSGGPTGDMKGPMTKTLEESGGIDAWSDFSFELTDDGLIQFTGTAYFKNISDVDVKFGSVERQIPGVRFVEGSGGMVLEMETGGEEGGEEPKPPATEPSEEEIQQQIQSVRAEFEQIKPMFSAIFSGMKFNLSYRLPGKIGEVTNFKKGEGDILSLTIDGARLIEILVNRLSDDKWCREQILAGRELMSDQPGSSDLNEELFGEKGPVRAVVTGELKPFFDYEAEVEAAKAAYDDMVKELGVQAGSPEQSIEAGEFEDLKVGGVRLVKIVDSERGIRPFNYDEGFSICLIGELPSSILEAREGIVEKALADNGEDLLPESEWDRRISFPSVSSDGKAITFEVRLKAPSEEVEGLKELSGKLECQVPGASKEVDLGLKKFKKKAKGTEFEAVIASIEDAGWDDGTQQLSLDIGLSRDKIKSITFYDDQDKKLDVADSGYSSGSDRATLEFRLEGGFPKTGRIVVEVYEQVDKSIVAFNLSNITLLGKPMA
jgi:hypothetical protein